jgi:hypothetical protein
MEHKHAPRRVALLAVAATITLTGLITGSGTALASQHAPVVSVLANDPPPQPDPDPPSEPEPEQKPEPTPPPRCDYFESSDLDTLKEDRWIHIQASRHNWARFGYDTRFQVKASIRNALTHGRYLTYGAKGTACQAQVVELEPNDTPHTIVVTYTVIKDVARISDAWILDVG